MIECPEAVRRMWAYIDQTLDPGPTEELEAHLDVCQRCCGELEFSRHLKELVAGTGADTIPDSLRGRFDMLLAGGGIQTDSSTAHD